MATELVQEELKWKIKQASQIVDSYKWLIDAYVVDFYQHDHWNNLPQSWADCFAKIPIPSLSELLSFDSQDKVGTVWPLAIIVLRSLFRQLVYPRQMPGTCTEQNIMLEGTKKYESSVFHEHSALFQKSVKLKKRHEIERFALGCYYECPSACKTMVDIGSGQGNLARTLAYGYGFRVCCIEQNANFVKKIAFHLLSSIRQKDSELWKRLLKNEPQLQDTIAHPIHLHESINLDEIDARKFVNMIKNALNEEKNQSHSDIFSFGLVGLHPCGDLAPSLLRLFLACRECRYIKLVCCCFMKLSNNESSIVRNDGEYGFPLSRFCREMQVTLSYEAKEIACHAIEQYRERLVNNYHELKVHAYRATIETIIVRLRPDLRHAGLKGGIRANEVTFEEYCLRTVVDIGLVIPQEEMHTQVTHQFLARWEDVVKFYTLRLMFAPLVETIILYDRLLFLLENGINARIDVLFDPFLSPRNHAITAFK